MHQVCWQAFGFLWPIILVNCVLVFGNIHVRHMIVEYDIDFGFRLKSTHTHEIRAHSQIYCTGDLLHTVQMAKLFDDSKTFVDMKLRSSPDKTLELFADFMVDHTNNPSTDAIRQFVNVS